MHYRNITLKTILSFVDYLVFFEELIDSCTQNCFNNVRKISEYRNGRVIIHVTFCSDFVDVGNLDNFAIAGKNTFSKHVVEKLVKIWGKTNLAA